MRALAFASVLVGIVGCGLGGPASAQIVPHTSDKASAAYSPAAVVQTGSRRWSESAGCFFCRALPSAARLPVAEADTGASARLGRNGALH